MARLLGPENKRQKNRVNSWLIDKMNERQVPVNDMMRILNCSKPQFYIKISNPAQYFNFNDALLISARLGIHVKHVIAWVYGVSDHSINSGRVESYWFE